MAFRVIAFLFLLLLGYTLTSFATEDEASIREVIDESFLSGEIKPISKEELEQVGVTLSSRTAGDEELAIEVCYSSELMELIGKRDVDVRFSIFGAAEKLVVTMPPYREEKVNFIVTRGYGFRVTVASKNDFKKLDKGVVYVFDYKNY